MLYKWRRKLKTWNFDRQIAAVLQTPPLHLVAADWTIASMIMRRDIPMYILGIKALYSYLGGGQVVGIVTRDLPAAWRDLLRRHVEGIELIDIEEIDTGACQRGGCWERLVYLLDRSERDYMVQMDADILAVGPDLEEVTDCIRRNVAFTMTENDRFHSLREAALRAQADTRDHFIGTVAEQCFDRYPDCDGLRYIRGSASLAGFPRGPSRRGEIEAFHRIMQGLLGSGWREWGTEQCASNFAVANAPGAVALPYPAYGTFGPGFPREQCKCFHFIGTHRFMDGYFARRGQEAIRRLRQPTVAEA